MITLAQIEAQYSLVHHEHLDRAADIPVVDGLGFQGDVAVRRISDTLHAITPLPAEGYPVVRGEAGGNTHLLVGDGWYDPSPSTDSRNLTLGVVTAPQGGTTLLSHPEHGGLIIAPGTYEIRRQREMSEEIRLVAD